jgi:hypothetical protein
VESQVFRGLFNGQFSVFGFQFSIDPQEPPPQAAEKLLFELYAL